MQPGGVIDADQCCKCFAGVKDFELLPKKVLMTLVNTAKQMREWPLHYVKIKLMVTCRIERFLRRKSDKK